jgi:hypothetical protein
MRRMMMLLPLLLVVGFGQQLLTNGGFEQDLSVGWIQELSGGGTQQIARDANYCPDLDMEAMAYQNAGPGWVRLSQMVDVPGVAVTLSFQAKFEIYGASSTCWPVAAVVVGYYDANSALLGETRYYCHDQYCNWTPSGRLSLINITAPDWLTYNLDVAQEVSENLPDVDPGAVSKVAIALYDTTAGG